MGDAGSVRIAGRIGCAIRLENKPRISSGDKSALIRENSKARFSEIIWAKQFGRKDLSGQIARNGNGRMFAFRGAPTHRPTHVLKPDPEAPRRIEASYSRIETTP